MAPPAWELNILDATSGDTGSAAEYAIRGKKGIRVFMMSPHPGLSSELDRFSKADQNRTLPPRLIQPADASVISDFQ